MAAEARAQEQFDIRVVDSERQNGLSERTAAIDLASPLAHPFQTEAFVALFNTDPSRPHFAVTAEDGAGLAAYWRGYFARYGDGPSPRSMAWVRSGPVVRADLVERREDFLSLMLAELKRHVHQQKVGWVMFTSEALYGNDCEKASREQGFQRYDLQTFMIDLATPEEELSKRINNRARRATKQARKHGVVVEDATSDEDIRSYYQVYLETTAVPGYRPPSEEEFLLGFRRLREEDGGRIIVAKHEGRVVAGSFFPCHAGFVAQHQHAVGAEGRSLNAGSLLVSESIRFFKENGFHSLDLVSVEVAPPEGSREAGVRTFKSNFGGELLDTPVSQYWSPARRIWRTIKAKLRRRRWSTPLSSSEPVAAEGE
jgi:hypothetical protein